MKSESDEVRSSNWPGKWLPIALVAMGLLVFGFRELWVYIHVEQAHRLANNLGLQLSQWVTGQQEVDKDYFRNLVTKEPRVAFLAVEDRAAKRQTGLINPAALDKAGPRFKDLLDTASIREALKLALEHESFAGPYVEAFTVIYRKEGNPAEGPREGTLRLGYVMPGFPFGRGYESILWGIEAGLLILIFLWGVGVAVVRVRRRIPQEKEAPPAELSQPEEPKDELDLLEIEMEQPTLRMEVDERGDSWRVLFNSENLDEWEIKGEWHISEESVIGQPWAASLTRTDLNLTENYRFRFQARKLSGKDGILALFHVGDVALTWVIGGWGNEYSGVGGYEETKRSFSMEKAKWYDFEVQVDKNEIKGFINDKELWKLSRKEVSSSSPDIGLKNGLGVGVWNAVARFKDLRFTMV